MALLNNAGQEDFFNFLAFSFSGLIGGFAGGSIAGLLSMLALRPYAPSISWKHMSPTIRIWAISGPLGMIISGILTVVMLLIGTISVQTQPVDCTNEGVSKCLVQIFGNATGETVAMVLLILAIFMIFLIIVWFLTGMLAGWLVVRHVRRLEPGITRRQGWSVIVSWGFAAILAAVIAILTLALLTNTFGL
jgi:hypothetical protein